MKIRERRDALRTAIQRVVWSEYERPDWDEDGDVAWDFGRLEHELDRLARRSLTVPLAIARAPGQPRRAAFAAAPKRVQNQPGTLYREASIVGSAPSAGRDLGRCGSAGSEPLKRPRRMDTR